ncbi:hypothetical protein GL270_21795 [Aeromonas veronii]|uniref:hypothetical protein n=1 Tax=Aeromonas veronii TaxID=654 RepID=UPI001C5B9C43|nr:hypothetical protein [Aeromonas veronii]MBW3783689.1 hypothetical protein [Aeromonas veronii]MBW3783831.1 hypothetical protein [Aeromonas veronii]
MTIEELTATVEAINQSQSGFRRAVYAELDTIKQVMATLPSQSAIDNAAAEIYARLSVVERQVENVSSVDRYAANRAALRKILREILSEGQ